MQSSLAQYMNGQAEYELEDEKEIEELPEEVPLDEASEVTGNNLIPLRSKKGQLKKQTDIDSSSECKEEAEIVDVYGKEDYEEDDSDFSEEESSAFYKSGTDKISK
jgi:hypothetical protein